MEKPPIVPQSEQGHKENLLERIFKLSERNTDVKTEVIAGLTSFMALSYIVLVIPFILSEAGIPQDAAVAAVIFSTVFCTLMFSLWANFPITVGPGMGLISFFTYTVVLGKGLSWQTALGAVFISGVVFFILTITGIRRKLFDVVPPTLRSAIGVGIGIFVAFTGLKNAGIIIPSETTYVTLGPMTEPESILGMAGLILASILMVKKVRGAMVISILLITVFAMGIGTTPAPQGLNDIVTLSVPDISATFLQMDLLGALKYGIISIIFSFTIVELFDNLATLLGLSKKAGLMDEKGKIPNLNQALKADSLGTMASACFGATALNTYIENATGIAEGGRTGLTALVTSGLLLLCLFLVPLVSLIPSEATAPVLILVGALMMSEIQHVSFDDFTETVPAFLTIIMMPLTFSIAEGLAFGFISYTLLKLLTGKAKGMHWAMYPISAAFIINFIFHGSL
ncbi:NCS2 family permease [Paludifilum halophilum]|uniref:Guanine permease n=1 Tax=Paludifilum halophilum TaxID=1642702 RepID=A0A235B9U9_9BACL|nr:NCS2 family permease [Paludifilum halophilum]OYD09080.1 guanine permease [Paludifilum halophilum]